MRQRRTPLFFAFLAIFAIAVAGIAQQSAPEAPAGFDTPTLGENPGSQSVSNGIPEPPGDSYALDQTRFEHRNGVDEGLGPVFNATACADCHQNPVTGGPSQITEIRAGHLDPSTGAFVNPTIPINDGANTIAGRSIVDDRAICAEAHEQLPDAENIRALRAVLNTLGDGFVEAIDDQTLLNIAATADALAGQTLFSKVGCATCHVPSIVTAPAGSVVNGGMFIVPDALGNKLINPYGDFLLHDVGTGDGIVQGGPADTINKLRTAPLWGLRTKTRFMHDLKSESLTDAINRHRGEARGVIDNFREELTPAQQQQVITFLKSL